METLCFSPSPVRTCNLRQSLSTFPVTTSPKHKPASRVVTATLINPTVQIFHKTSTSPPILPPNKTTLPPPPLTEVSAESLSYESGHLGAVPEKQATGVGDGVHNAMSYLTKILSAKVYDVAVESPLDYASKLSERLGVHLWLKREDLQPVFSFKLRGAYNMMAKLTREELEKGVICSSAGNHAQGVALSAQRLDCHAVIAMPVTTPEIKWKSVERLGATVVLVGESYDETQAYAKKRAEDEGRTFIPPFDHPEVIAGQGTIGMEIVRQLPAASLHAIFVPVGGGGLIAGIAAYVKRVRPEVKIIGVEPYDANAMALSLHHGQRVKLSRVGGFADGVAVKVVGEETFRLCNDLIDGVDMFEETRSILEPAGALAIAGAEAYCKKYGVKGENIVAITSGANMNFDRLRLISQLADVGRRREAILVTCMPEKWGNFKKFYELVNPLNITEFRYRKDVQKEEALVLYSVGFQSALHLKDMLERMESTKLQTLNLTNNDLLKDHLQFLVGGQSNVDHEILCRFIFPERPGALGKFLDIFSPRWNITLVHYRAQGETHANVLVGLQVAASEMVEFKALSNSLGYDYAFETDNEALQILFR
ncbi:hypothetical protein JRO89_XS10G0181500 [Xanthoceras sorbifolium]|uniref:Threonine dehydratase n=1 Tax=Xanthoceras sorbifolium TaxID=99658 RepID=A0ABQ8HJA9_9ROSI|nr:hypothetical protein JRO89_XS10G0181500 [Xanthoceras sorbifolium]